MGPSCGDICKQSFAVEGNEAPCDKCRVELLPENEEAWRVFLAVQCQVIVGMGDPIAINVLALKFEMELQGIPRERWARIRDKVNAAFGEIQRLRAEK